MNQQNTPTTGGSDQQMNTPASSRSVGMPMGAGASASGQGQLDPEAQAALNPNPGNLSTNSGDFARDPVCGTLVEKASATNTLPASVNMPGEDTIYFDSPECKAIYEQNPERYGSQR